MSAIGQGVLKLDKRSLPMQFYLLCRDCMRLDEPFRMLGGFKNFRYHLLS